MGIGINQAIFSYKLFMISKYCIQKMKNWPVGSPLDSPTEVTKHLTLSTSVHVIISDLLLAVDPLFLKNYVYSPNPTSFTL